MKNTQFKVAIALSIMIAIVIVSCKKETSTSIITPAGKQNIAVYLNDDPTPNLLKVLVNVKYIEVKVDSGNLQHEDDYYDGDNDGDDDFQKQDRYGRWDTLSVTPRVYDLLKLKNGVDTLIASSYANIGKITKVRITLGSDNTVWTDSTHSYPLPLCDKSPYLYVKIKSNSIETLQSGQVRIRIDFDVARSIEFERGNYCLKPKLKSYSDNNTGKIEGIVKPGVARAMVKVFNATDTAYAIPEEDGEYKIRGLKPAIYTITYKAVAPYKDTTINNIQVVAGQQKKIPLVTLHQ